MQTELLMMVAVVMMMVMMKTGGEQVRLCKKKNFVPKTKTRAASSDHVIYRHAILYPPFAAPPSHQHPSSPPADRILWQLHAMREWAQ
jgi:hypothetical protein